MIYNDFCGLKVSALGFGAMRLPTIGGRDSVIDEESARDMVDLAMERGINYYDTAWGYHGGNSETVMGKLLRKYKRDSYYLASKFPGYALGNMDKVEEIFEKQLEKCQVEYFDFYLFHNVCEMNIDAYLNPEYRIYKYLMEQKEKGRIKHLGFSAHGDYEVIERFLKAYGEGMEFCQLQINWLDWDFQNAKKKAELVESYGLPIIVMEPLRGGKLAKLDKVYAGMLREVKPDTHEIEWAFRFIQSLPNIITTLSGMSDIRQLEQNISFFHACEPLNKNELTVLDTIAWDMLEVKTVPCTGCNYCISHCPQELNIPKLLELFNEHSFSGGGFIAPMALSGMPKEKHPGECIGCQACEQVCPQGIEIAKTMSDFDGLLKSH